MVYFVQLGLDLKLYTLEKDTFSDLAHSSVRNWPSVSFGTNFPCNCNQDIN